jgi:hypothetical protein
MAASQIGDRASRSDDHHGCYELYACTARLVLATVKGADGTKERLQRALHECAVVADAERRARLLRCAFDEIVAGAPDSGPASVDEAAQEPVQVMQSYIGLAIEIGAPAYNSGDHRGCYEVYACTARMLLATVDGADEVKHLLRQALERCATLSDPNQQAWAMRHAFDAICGTPPNPLETIRSYLAMAIQIGAPAYNYGDHRGCYEVYACTGRLLLRAVDGADDTKQILRQALDRCQAVHDVKQQAWIMRDAFDTVLGEGGGGPSS